MRHDNDETACGDAVSAAATTGDDQRAAHLRPFRWPPGHSGNPRGRAKGSRHRLSEDFLSALANDFDKNGKEAIEACRITDPVAYVRLVASLLSKDANISSRPFEDLSDDELHDAIATIKRYFDAGASSLPTDLDEERAIAQRDHMETRKDPLRPAPMK